MAATTGSRAHTALAAGMNSTARYSNRRTIRACRTYRPPARSASTSRSGEPASDALGRPPARHHRGDADERHGVEREHPARRRRAATTKPPMAGPTARATFMFKPLSAAACGSSAAVDQVGLDRLPRGAGDRVAAAQREGQRQDQRRGRRRRGRSTRPAPPRPGTSPAGRPAAAAAGPPRPPRRRPAGRAARSAGWRRSAPTTPAAESVSISSHCAPTVCIHVPTLDANCAIHSARKTGK